MTLGVLQTVLRVLALEELSWSNVGTRHESLSKSDRRGPTWEPEPVGSAPGSPRPSYVPWVGRGSPFPYKGMRELDYIYLLRFLFQ